jgi:hypothetical protein
LVSIAGGTLPVRRKRSAKLGPGSSAGENRGSVIGRGGYRLHARGSPLVYGEKLKESVTEACKQQFGH